MTALVLALVLGSPPARAEASTAAVAGSSWPARIADIVPPPAAKRPRHAPPLAESLERVFGPDLWAKVEASTAGAAGDVTELLRQGFYKSEVIQLVMLSAEAGRSLRSTVERRLKGASLARIALDYGIAYDAFFERALVVEGIVDRDYMPRFPERRARRRAPE